MAERIIAFIGAGRMGEALIRSLLHSGRVASKQILASDLDAARLRMLADELQIRVAKSNREAVPGAHSVVLAVKPQIVPAVLAELAGAFTSEQTLVSIAAGMTTDSLCQLSGLPPEQVVRVMPNTPALVGAGVAAIAVTPQSDAARVAQVRELFSVVGSVVEVDEKLMDAVTGLSGSGPAFVFQIIEALSDGGVAAGLPRVIATELAARTVLGAARLVLERGEHPAALKDMVASPGGTTIAGLRAMEAKGVRAALIEAVVAAAKRSEELSKG
jgi:pyrroline-5-carboxylate reductase